MKSTNILLILAFILFSSCASVSVNSDYDKKIDFSKYKTYAFYKTGIDKVEISDLDKKRILHSIEEEMTLKGFAKSELPDLLVNINTKEQKNLNINQFQSAFGYGWGFGWNPYFGMNYNVNSNTEGILTIDLIDASKKELVWQGEGIGYLTQNTNKKDENIKNFVIRILSQYPPKLEVSK
jgi:hypothetical protein